MIITDIKEMPNYNAKVPNGADSVSTGKVFFGKNDWMPDYASETVCCAKHGAMNAMSQDRRIWRCTVCHEGAYVKEF